MKPPSSQGFLEVRGVIANSRFLARNLGDGVLDGKPLDGERIIIHSQAMVEYSFRGSLSRKLVRLSELYRVKGVELFQTDINRFEAGFGNELSKVGKDESIEGLRNSHPI